MHLVAGSLAAVLTRQEFVRQLAHELHCVFRPKRVANPVKKLLVPLTAIQILENVTEFLAWVCRNGRSLHLNHYFAPVLAETFLNRLLEQEVEGVAQ